MPDKDTPNAPRGATTAILSRMQGRILICDADGDYYAPASSDVHGTAAVTIVDSTGGLRLTITVVGFGKRVSDMFPVAPGWLDVLCDACDTINGLGIDWLAPDLEKLGPVLRHVAIACQHAWLDGEAQP